MLIPLKFEAQIRPRIGLSSKGLLASFGTVDATFSGELKVVLFNLTPLPKKVKIGDRIAQLIISQLIQGNFKQVADIPGTDRGDKGFGSTGIR